MKKFPMPFSSGIFLCVQAFCNDAMPGQTGQDGKV